MIRLSMIAGANAAAALTTVKLIATRHPGEHDLTIHTRTPDELLRGEKGRALLLGEPWRYSASEACLASLREFGDVAVENAT